MEESNIINEIRLLLMNQKNCSETLKDQEFRLDVTGKDNLEEPILFLKKVMTSPTPDGEEPTEEVTKEKYHLYEKGENETVHGNARIKITKYFLQYNKEVVDNLKKVGREEVNFMVNFTRDSNSFGSVDKAYKIPLEITVDSSMKLENCSSLGLPTAGKAGILALDANKSPSLSGLSGVDACKSKGMDCAYVQSTNYLLKSDGLDAPLYSPACQSSYNQEIEGVKKGVGVSNIHSCSAKLGSYQTFILESGSASITCAGTFVAFCN
jgi:hypothetical protein